MLISLAWLAALIVLALLSWRFGVDSRDLEKTLNSKDPVRPQI